MRDPRMFYSGCLYEIVFRARRGIPLPPRPLLNELILSALARTQRDFKVTICNFIWMGNHVHILIISKDIKELTNFYGELKKRLTESVKRLLNMGYSDHLSLWEDRVKVPQILDLAAAVERTIYMFCNPAAASLVDSIDEYPGLSTWKSFQTLAPESTSAAEQEVAWIRMPQLPGLSSQNFSRNEERQILNNLASSCKETCTLITYPFAWLKVFGVTESLEIEEYRKAIVTEVYRRESEYKETRRTEKRRVFGRERLLNEGINFKHAPKDRGPTLSVLSTIKELRIDFLLRLRAFKEEVRECYEQMKKGHLSIDWPLQAFIPSRPVLVNPLWV